MDVWSEWAAYLMEKYHLNTTHATENWIIAVKQSKEF